MIIKMVYIIFINVIFFNLTYADEVWTDNLNTIIHNSSGFIFPKDSGEFKFIKVSEKQNPHFPRATGISYKIPEKGILMLVALTPNLRTPEQNAKKLFSGSLSVFKSLNEGNIKITELTPPHYGKEEDRYAAWIAMEKSPKKGTFAFVFSDRDYLLSMVTVHPLNIDPKLITLSMDTFLKNLNWSNLN